jgi:hypothetical protein
VLPWHGKAMVSPAFPSSGNAVLAQRAVSWRDMAEWVPGGTLPGQAKSHPPERICAGSMGLAAPGGGEDLWQTSPGWKNGKKSSILSF